ncbi:hypothetical protein QAD02_018181 [Eretmocerus hayati]|uniref:Uncharacterized protein n=1 Tax=Eretmocerus hayati TaxID=131215 RepID=A0ACC2PFM3_9HYME|nr:hypothetical protein QAD02_018181 [Eretmocerus hayati]
MPPNQKLIKKKCAVAECKSITNKDFKVSLHPFPTSDKRFVYITDRSGSQRKIDLLAAWLKAVKMKKEEITRYSSICSLHFTREDYFSTDSPVKRLILKVNAVPSVNLSQVTRVKSVKNEALNITAGDKRKNKTRFLDDENIVKQSYLHIGCSAVGLSDGAHDSEHIINQLKDHDYCVKNNIIDENHLRDIHIANTTNSVIGKSCNTNTSPANSTIKVQKESIHQIISAQRDLGVQVDQRYKFLDAIKSEKQLIEATGIKSFEMLNKIVEKMNDATDDRYESSTILMTTEKRIIMTFVKLKHDLSYSFLSAIMNTISRITCKKIFIETVRFLNKHVDELAIPWPSDLKGALEDICQSADFSNEKDESLEN